MNEPLTREQHERLRELLADAQFDALAPDEQGELEALLERADTAPDLGAILADALLAFDAADDEASPQSNTARPLLPSETRERLVAQGRRALRDPRAIDTQTRATPDNTTRSDAHTPAPVAAPPHHRATTTDTGEPKPIRRSFWSHPAALALAACLALVAGIAALAIVRAQESQRLAEQNAQLADDNERLADERATELAEAESALEASRQSIAALEAQVVENRAIIARANERVEALTQSLAEADDTVREREGEIARLAEREVELAARLAAATEDLDAARLTIARYEAPEDPAVLAENRRKLLEVPGTVRMAWSPFDLPDAPAEQREVTGDVVWNDELETGYLRFVGLDVNDPNIEQYQVWVIDERGMEQKVSGGVFNATAEGEVIVPIEPGIPVGRVALFAITVENPGGTWVPNLERRVVVAPREEG
ncbi:MAG: hypothetical protein ACTS3F_06525 [Phycisphaerales bacterium]